MISELPRAMQEEVNMNDIYPTLAQVLYYTLSQRRHSVLNYKSATYAFKIVYMS